MQKFLFDLTNDPYETTNLINSTDPDIVAARDALYEIAETLMDNAAPATYTQVYYENNIYCTSFCF